MRNHWKWTRIEGATSSLACMRARYSIISSLTQCSLMNIILVGITHACTAECISSCMTALLLIEVLHDLHAQLYLLFPLTPCLLATIIYAVVKLS